jgi:hypothetical protein
LRGTALILAMALAAPAFGTGSAGDIPPEEWTDFAAGKTLTYTLGGQVWAHEQYHPDPNSRLVWIELVDGTCMAGTWDYVDGLYCFYWADEIPACFRHARNGGRIEVIPMENGIQAGDTQVMSEVTERPLACSFGLSS